MGDLSLRIGAVVVTAQSTSTRGNHGGLEVLPHGGDREGEGRAVEAHLHNNGQGGEGAHSVGQHWSVHVARQAAAQLLGSWVCAEAGYVVEEQLGKSIDIEHRQGTPSMTASRPGDFCIPTHSDGVVGSALSALPAIQRGSYAVANAKREHARGHGAFLRRCPEAD